jgi:Glycosyltransferase
MKKYKSYIWGSDKLLNEMKLLKKQVKENIQFLINDNKLYEAMNLIEEYLKIDSNDSEIYSMKAIVFMMKGDMNEAENILSFGLNKEPYNRDLLFNMSYLMDQKRYDKKALEYFCKANLYYPDDNIKIEDIIPNYIIDDNSNIKVLHGTMEIANQMNSIVKGLNKKGIDAKTLNYHPNYLGYKCDYTLDINAYSSIDEADVEIKKLASNMIANNDIFHFHFGTSLTLDYSDLQLIEKLDKKMVMQYWGSDVRLYSKAKELNPYVKVKDMNEDGIKRRLEYISEFIPHCIVDYELAEYVKGYHSNIHYSAVAIDLSKYKFIEETNNEKLLIVHAPTAPEFKGSNYILKAIEELKMKYDFDFKIVQGVAHEDAVKIYQQADLIIDQILIGSYGVFAVESMAMGKPIICWISDFMKDKYPKELPIISANPDTIKEKIEYAINNKDMLRELGSKGRKYVEKYHDMNIISRNMIEIYNKI